MKLFGAICLCLVLAVPSSTAQNEDTTTSTPPVVPETVTSSVAESTTALPTSEVTTTTTVTEGPTAPSSEIPTTTTSLPTSEVTTTPVTESTSAVPAVNKTEKFVGKLSDQIRSVLTLFDAPNPTGFLSQTVLEDPMPAPNATVGLALGTGHFYNLTVHGLSNFTVETVSLLLDEMQAYVMIRIPKVLIKGNCTVETFVTKSRSLFNMTLVNVTAEGTVTLKADDEGKLRANKSSSDLSYQELVVGSGESSMYQTMLNGAGALILQSIQPQILSHIDARLIETVNKYLEHTPNVPVIAKMSPIDLAVLEGRRYVRKFYEPYTIESFANHESEFLIVRVGPVTIHGLSKFARVGGVEMQMRGHVIQLTVRMITGRLAGKCKFFYDFGKAGLTRQGESTFSVEHVQFEAKVNQSMDLKKKPILDDLQLEVGTVRVKMDGAGDFDYLVDMTAHMIPDLLRHFIIDALEEPIKQKIQSEILDKIDVGKLVEDNSSFLENLSRKLFS